MSEYQYYEFLAVDRPLDHRQQAEVRSLSTRASITATSFVNEYHWGNFRGDPRRMMERYYDAHLYLTNGETHRIMLRLPRELLDTDVAEDHCVGDQVTVWTTGKFPVLDMTTAAGRYRRLWVPTTSISSTTCRSKPLDSRNVPPSRTCHAVSVSP